MIAVLTALIPLAAALVGTEAGALDGPRVLSLDEAERVGLAHQPLVAEARAEADAAAARADQARAPLLPQLTGTAAYQRSTANYVARPGASPASTNAIATAAARGTSYDFYNASLTLSQLLWDFGQTTNRWRAARAGARVQAASAETQRQQVLLRIRTTYFAAQATHALVVVARDGLGNSDRHLTQIRAFVDVGTRPEIDIAQALTARANAEVRLIQAENDEVAARAELDAAMGLERPADYHLSDEPWGPITGESEPLDALVTGAISRRPDVRAPETQLAAQELTLQAARNSFWPALGAGATASEAGPTPDNLIWNWNAQLVLNWTLFQGALTPAQIREQRAQLSGAAAARDLVRQTTTLEVLQATNGVRAQRAVVAAAGRAVESARRQLALAEARYDTGMGSALELDDAQLALTNAGAQAVTAQFSLSTARAQLAKALGLSDSNQWRGP